MKIIVYKVQKIKNKNHRAWREQTELAIEKITITT